MADASVRSGDTLARATWVVTAGQAGMRLDRFLADPDRLGSRSRAASALDRAQVFLNDREVGGTAASTVLREGDRVRLWRDRPGSASRHTRGRQIHGVRIVYEDECLIVADKPAGLLTVPHPRHRESPSVLDHLVAEYGARARLTPLVVHRIDRDTSGLVVFAKTPSAWRHLKEQFVRREPERVYLAVVTGAPDPPRGAWRDLFIWNARGARLEPARPPAHGVLDAELRYRTIERLRGASLVEVCLVTGRRNQVRAQFALHGHPLVGERQYVPEAQTPIAFPRQALHAHRLAFDHPVTGRRASWESPLPQDLWRLIERLRDRAAVDEGASARDPASTPPRRAGCRRRAP